MANVAVSIFGTNIPIRLTDIGDGSYALSTHAYAVGQPLGANDKVLSLTGTNLPVRVFANGDGSFALGTAIPVSAGAAGDASVSIFGINYPSRLVALGDGTYALGIEPQATGTAMVAGDCVASMLGINVPVRLIKQSKGDYAVAIASAVTPRPAADMVASLWGVNPPSRLVGMGDRTFALASDDYFQKVLSIAPSNLVAFWPLNEASGTVAYDQAGNRHNGAYVGTLSLPVLGQPGIGDGGTSVFFVKTDGTRVNVFSSGLASVFNGKEGTLSIWFKVTGAATLTDGAQHYTWILAQDAPNQINFLKTATNNQYQFLYNAGGTLKTITITDTSLGWQNSTMTWSKSGDAMKGFINGVQVGTTQTGLGTYVGSITDGNANIGLGGATWDGYLALVALWSTPLSAAQVLSLATVP